jgi:putative endonuclease
MKTYSVYILSNTSRMLYIGVTGDLHSRLWQHKKKLIDGFTSRYNLHSLVYFELFGNINAAIAREKELKRWGRQKKLELINSKNPSWTDLAGNLFSKPKTRADGSVPVHPRSLTQAALAPLPPANRTAAPHSSSPSETATPPRPSATPPTNCHPEVSVGGRRTSTYPRSTNPTTSTSSKDRATNPVTP